MSGHEPLLRVWETVTAGAGSQLSVAVTVAGAGTESHSTVAGPGTPTRLGRVVSRTVTTCERDDVLPQRSVAVQVRAGV